MPTLVEAITEIERLGFDYKEVAQYNLGQLSVDRRVQVRESTHYAPKDVVERYSVMMGESEFPDIVVTSDAWIVDGNTRVGAALKRKNKFFPAVVLAISWESATPKQRHELKCLAATLNAHNGMPLTAKEARAITREFLELGWKNEQIARSIGIRPTGIAGVKRELDAEAKLQRVGMGTNGDLKGISLRALGHPEALALNDVPFKTLATMAADAGLNVSEIATIAKEAKDKGSDAGAIDYLEATRQEMADRIRQRALTGIGRPPVARQLRQHLGFVVHFAGREQELVEKNTAVVGQHLEALQASIEVLRVVLSLQS